MQLTRRQFIQSAVTASAATIAPLSLASITTQLPEMMPIDFGWGFIDQENTDVDVMAKRAVSTMEKSLARYDVVGWAKEPDWRKYDRKGQDAYKLSCTPLVRAVAGRPVYRSIL
ncbi:MAG: hypothetical protein V4563_17570 [Pseudomonadota bacterium]